MVRAATATIDKGNLVMKLSNTAIREALDSGSLVIQPTPHPEDINVTTVDCKLGPIIYVLDTAQPRSLWRWIVHHAASLLKLGNPSSQFLTGGKELYFDSEDEGIQAFWERHGRQIDLRTNVLPNGKKGYWLRPGEICLAMTAEHFTLPLDGKQVLQGTIWSRSRTARAFIRVHVDAPEVKPGTDNCVTLEIKNEGTFNVRLFHNQPIAQMSFEEVKGEIAPFHSDFHGQKHASGAHACTSA